MAQRMAQKWQVHADDMQMKKGYTGTVPNRDSSKSAAFETYGFEGGALFCPFSISPMVLSQEGDARKN